MERQLEPVVFYRVYTCVVGGILDVLLPREGDHCRNQD